MDCCSKCVRLLEYISYDIAPLALSGGAAAACVSTTIALNHMAGPSAPVIDLSSGRSPKSRRTCAAQGR